MGGLDESGQLFGLPSAGRTQLFFSWLSISCLRQMHRRVDGIRRSFIDLCLLFAALVGHWVLPAAYGCGLGASIFQSKKIHQFTPAFHRVHWRIWIDDALLTLVSDAYCVFMAALAVFFSSSIEAKVRREARAIAAETTAAPKKMGAGEKWSNSQP